MTQDDVYRAIVKNPGLTALEIRDKCFPHMSDGPVRRSIAVMIRWKEISFKMTRRNGKPTRTYTANRRTV